MRILNSRFLISISFPFPIFIDIRGAALPFNAFAHFANYGVEQHISTFCRIYGTEID